MAREWPGNMFNGLKKWTIQLKHNLYALYLACHHKDIPLYAKLLAITVVSYALSPIDLIPDFIPVLGYLDDFILLPLGIILSIKMIPEDIWEECKKKARHATLRSLPRSKTAAVIVICIWTLIALSLYQLIFPT